MIYFLELSSRQPKTPIWQIQNPEALLEILQQTQSVNGKNMSPSKGVKSGGSNWVSISCPTCSTRHDFPIYLWHSNRKYIFCHVWHRFFKFINKRMMTTIKFVECQLQPFQWISLFQQFSSKPRASTDKIWIFRTGSSISYYLGNKYTICGWCRYITAM